MVGGGRDFRLGGFEKLMVSLVPQLRYSAANQVAGIRKNLYAVIAVLLDGGRYIVFLQEDARLRARRFEQIKAMIAQPVQRFFVSPCFYLRCHFVLRSRLG